MCVNARGRLWGKRAASRFNIVRGWALQTHEEKQRGHNKKGCDTKNGFEGGDVDQYTGKYRKHSGCQAEGATDSGIDGPVVVGGDFKQHAFIGDSDAGYQGASQKKGLLKEGRPEAGQPQDHKGKQATK